MNPENKKKTEAIVSELQWLKDLKIEPLPAQLHPHVASFKVVGGSFLRSFITAKNADLSDETFNLLVNYWNTFSRVLSPLKEQANGQPTISVQDLINQIHQAIQITNYWLTNNNTPGFPMIVAYIASFSENLTDVENLTARINKYESLSADADKLLKEMQKTASQLSVERFAEIFGDQARTYSRFWQIKPVKERSWLNRLKLGASQQWLLIGVGILLTPIIIPPSFPEPADLQSSASIALFALKKLFFISIWIFAIRFAFRNFSHYKYLAIQNEHRQNILNSMQLLLQSMTANEATARTALLQEVAKNIYFGDKNPFLISPSKSDADMHGILEILKLINHR